MPAKAEQFQPAIWFKLAIDHKEVAYFTELSGAVSEAALDGSGLRRGILSSSSATGVALVHVPTP